VECLSISKLVLCNTSLLRPLLCYDKNEVSCGLYYKHITVVNYNSSVVNKCVASLSDDARVVIYDRHVFVVQATEYGSCTIKLFTTIINAVLSK